MDIKFHMQVRCSCGWGLEEDTKAVPYLGTVTVKPCPVCCGGEVKKLAESRDKETAFGTRGYRSDD